MAKNAHLVLDERATIEVRIRERASFTEIGRELGKDPSTISKEVRLHSQTVRKDSFNPCGKRSTCDEYGTACSKCKLQYSKSCKRCPRVKCYEHCKQFEVLVCNKLKKPPYVCNGCIQRQSCKLEKHIYSAKSAQKNYETTRSESRQGIAITPEELKRVDAIVSPLVKLGQSIHMICVNNADDIMLDEKTIYNYIDAGLLSVDNVDLPRKVRYRTRSHKKPVRVDKQCHVGRTYEDFEAYLAANPDIPVVEMDSVEGRKGGKVLLTIYFRNSSLMLAFRGSEFTNPLAIEFNKGNGRRTHIFYCDPQRSDQKGGCEVTHEMIRRVLPKKISFDNLTQDDINLMMSHINSYNRKKLNNQSAHQLFSFINGGDILDKLGIKSIPANEINLTPLLLKK
ncbi:MAG: IS30 family transposase [Clostridiales bacterium]|nr:IS30 family transposase [Clostridiales bacterium]